MHSSAASCYLLPVIAYYQLLPTQCTNCLQMHEPSADVGKREQAHHCDVMWCWLSGLSQGLFVLGRPLCAVFMLSQGALVDCSKHDIEDMILQQLALETIFVAEKLSIPDQEFQDEYEDAKHQFEATGSEFDDAKLREQVAETLKVRPVQSTLV